ncbi:MAG: hypothetical protein ACE5JL_08225 [Dehalococcoidia bacterium]
MSIPAKPMKEYDSVRNWLASYSQFWEGDEPSPEALESLSRFCQLVDGDPDSIIAECLRPESSGEGLLLRTGARRRYIERILEFERQDGSRTRGNHVRSFFIHNGVAMNPSIIR